MNRALVIGLAGAAFIGALILKGREARPQSPLAGRAMGTGWTLAWRGNPPPHLHREVAETLDHWEQVMSQWRSSSHLSRCNRGEPASADLARVIRLAEAVRDASNGAFNHQILESVHAAGFGPPGTGVDLSGIGKGFAADRVGERLRQLGVHDFVFELGGEVIAGDGDWTVEIERPIHGGRDIARTLKLRNRAVATSGNYHQLGATSRDPGGRLTSHLIDPRTAKPVIRHASSVTVVADDCATADAWATALFVLGPEFRNLPKDIEATWQFE